LVCVGIIRAVVTAIRDAISISVRTDEGSDGAHREVLQLAFTGAFFSATGGAAVA